MPHRTSTKISLRQGRTDSFPSSRGEATLDPAPVFLRDDVRPSFSNKPQRPPSSSNRASVRLTSAYGTVPNRRTDQSADVGHADDESDMQYQPLATTPSMKGQDAGREQQRVLRVATTSRGYDGSQQGQSVDAYAMDEHAVEEPALERSNSYQVLGVQFPRLRYSIPGMIMFIGLLIALRQMPFSSRTPARSTHHLVPSSLGAFATNLTACLSSTPLPPEISSNLTNFLPFTSAVTDLFNRANHCLYSPLPSTDVYSPDFDASFFRLTTYASSVLPLLNATAATLSQTVSALDETNRILLNRMQTPTAKRFAGVVYGDSVAAYDTDSQHARGCRQARECLKHLPAVAEELLKEWTTVVKLLESVRAGLKVHEWMKSGNLPNGKKERARELQRQRLVCEVVFDATHAKAGVETLQKKIVRSSLFDKEARAAMEQWLRGT